VYENDFTYIFCRTYGSKLPPPIRLHKVILFSYFTAGTEGTNKISRSGKLVTTLEVEVDTHGVRVSKYTNANSKHIMKVLFYFNLGSSLSFLSCLEIFLSRN